jgi:hypothetical protein
MASESTREDSGEAISEMRGREAPKALAALFSSRRRALSTPEAWPERNVPSDRASAVEALVERAFLP